MMLPQIIKLLSIIYIIQEVTSFSIQSSSSSTAASHYSKGIATSSATKEQQKKAKKKQKTNTTSSSSTTIPIIACSSNIELERAISFYIEPNDSVLELGSQLSDISTFICQQVFFQHENSNDRSNDDNDKNDIGKQGSVLHVDIKRKDASSGRCKPRDFNTFVQRLNKNKSSRPTKNKEEEQQQQGEDNVQFQELDKFDQWRDIIKPKRRKEEKIYDVMILDVGTMIGNDLYLTALSIANEFIAHQERSNQDKEEGDDNDHHQHHHHQPRVIIIKSKTLSTLARRLLHSQRLFDNTITNLPPPTQLPRSNTPYIIATVGVNEYRRTIPYTTKKGDFIIEVGCHFGQSTVLLHDAVSSSTQTTNNNEDDDIKEENGFCIGVDIGPKIIQQAKDKYPHVPFHVGNAWNILQLLKFRQTYVLEEQEVVVDKSHAHELGYDLVYADIGGLSGSDGLLESLSLLDSIGQGIEPRCIVIKSLCMNRLASQLKAFTDVWAKIEKKE